MKFAGYFTGFGSKADGSARLSFSTQELNADDFKLLKENLNSFGWLLFQSNEIKSEDLPNEQAEDGSKTPSKRLRATLFILWKQQGEKNDFEQFYRTNMEKLIKVVKSKLD